MSILQPEFEYVDRATEAIRYLDHGWPTNLCRWHSHPEYELHLLLETSGKAFVGDYIGEYTKGALFLVGPNLPHNWVTDEREYPEPVPLRDMAVQFNQESIDHLSNAFPEFHEMASMFELAASGIQFDGFNATFARGHFEAIRDTRGAERIVAFLRFLVRVNEHAEKRRLSMGSVAIPEFKQQPRIARVIDHLTENFAENVSLDEAAALAGMSPAAFSRKFQKFTGNRFVEFVNRLRIGHACSLLQTTDAQVSTICFDVGFQNLANFNRQFFKMKNMTPTAFRDLSRNELTTKSISKGSIAKAPIPNGQSAKERTSHP